MKTLKTLSLVAVIIAAQSSLQAMSKIKENFNNAKLKVKTSLAQTYATGKKHGFFSTNVIDASLKAPLSVPTKHAVFENAPSTTNNHSFSLDSLQLPNIPKYNQIHKVSWNESPRFSHSWKGAIDHQFSIYYADDRMLYREYTPSTNGLSIIYRERNRNEAMKKCNLDEEGIIDVIEYLVLGFKDQRAQYNDQCAQSNIKNVTNLSQDTYL